MMKAGFPAYDTVALDWTIVARTGDCPPAEVQRFVESAFVSEQVLVEVNRFTGGLFSLAEAAAFAAPHVGRETVRFADRGFTSFAVIASPGVAASWVKGTVVKREVSNDV